MQLSRAPGNIMEWEQGALKSRIVLGMHNDFEQTYAFQIYEINTGDIF